jgi:hypothetical protein
VILSSLNGRHRCVEGRIVVFYCEQLASWAEVKLDRGLHLRLDSAPSAEDL